jgi:hypothetical protein
MRGAATAIVIRNMSAEFADSAAEDEGIWTNGGSDTTIYGSVHQKMSEEVNESTVGQLSEQRNIICRIPLSASVTYGDQIVIADINPVINGTYEIDSLMYTKTHVRAECRRTLR